jgi:hypothetical protein
MATGVWLNYCALLDHLLTGFRPDQIRFVDYRSACAHEDGVVGFFLAHLGVPLKARQLQKINDGHSNASPPALGCWAANAIAAPGTAGKALIGMALGAFRAEYGDRPSCLFTRAEISMIHNRFDPENARLARRLADTQGKFRISPSPLSMETVHREDVGAGFWLRCSRRLHHDWQ